MIARSGGLGVAMVLLAALAACEPGHLEYGADGHRTGHGRRVDELGDGRWTLFDGRGGRVATGSLAEGAMVGIWKRFYGDGALQEQAVLVRGLRDGSAVTFHPGGSRASSGSYRSGVREGAWVFWTPTGAVDDAQTGLYRGGNRVPW